MPWTLVGCFRQVLLPHALPLNVNWSWGVLLPKTFWEREGKSSCRPVAFFEDGNQENVFFTDSNMGCLPLKGCIVGRAAVNRCCDVGQWWGVLFAGISRFTFNGKFQLLRECVFLKGLGANNGRSAFLNKPLTGETEADWGWVRVGPGLACGGQWRWDVRFPSRRKKRELI